MSDLPPIRGELGATEDNDSLVATGTVKHPDDVIRRSELERIVTRFANLQLDMMTAMMQVRTSPDKASETMKSIVQELKLVVRQTAYDRDPASDE